MRNRLLLGILAVFAVLIVGLSIYVTNPHIIYFIMDIFSNKPRPGSCLILEQKYCNTVKFIYNGSKGTAAYNIPVGTLIFSPIDGVFDTTTTYNVKNSQGNYEKQQGATLYETPDGRIQHLTYQFNFIYTPYKADISSGNSIKKGEILGKIGGPLTQAYKKLAGDYTLLVYVTKQDYYKPQPGNQQYPTSHDIPTTRKVVDATDYLKKLLSQ